MKDHKQYIIETKNGRCQVDREMRSIIKFMNSLGGVSTLFSCQGYALSKTLEKRKPYILFTCEDQESLFKVVKSLTFVEGDNFYKLGLITIDVNFDFFRYTIRFNDRECMKIFLKQLKEFSRIKVEVSLMKV